MTSAIDYADATRKASAAFATSLDTWKDSVTSVTEQFRSFPTVGTLPTIDLTEAVERQFALIQQVVDVNHQYARQLAEAATSLTGVAREQLESVSSAVRDQVETVTQVARTSVDTVEKTVSDQADEQARAPYAGLTKAQLSEEAAKRGLPKSGTVDELVARLVEADTK
jgi:hypothetical protein